MNTISHATTIHYHEAIGEILTDEDLVAAAQLGETSAFVELNARYARTLLPRVYQITRNWEDAEDVIQDSFLKAFVHIKQFEGRSTFSTWITRIAINSALMLLRKRRVVEISLEYQDEESGASRTIEVKDSRRDPEQSYLDNERVEWLNGAILHLKPCLREAIQLSGGSIDPRYRQSTRNYDNGHQVSPFTSQGSIAVARFLMRSRSNWVWGMML